jgi:hypothetical protein
MRRGLLAAAAAVLVALSIAGSALAATTDTLFIQFGYGQGTGFPPAITGVAVPLSGTGACSLGATCQPVQGLLTSLKLNGCSVLPATVLPLGGVNDWPRSEATEVAVCSFP